ncbi:MAG: outer membrane lipoprotein-sorting protein [Bacteroidia bacterium]|nr:outer membrane lipoprotein-sorting protein [Bacteroidia bacterium]
MKFPLFIIVILLLGGVSNAQDARSIIKRSEEKVRGKTSAYSEITIEIIRKKWSREMSLRSWSKGDKFSVILLTAPAKDKGIVFLKRDKEVWNWIPSIERTIKLPPSMMMQSWMGTDFTNDDLVRESSLIDDYNAQLLGDSTIEGRRCHKIVLIPKEDAAVVWGKLILFIDANDFIQLRSEMYDEDEYLINVMNASNIKEMDEVMIATESEIIPVENPDQKTKMRIDKIVFDEEMEDKFFSIQMIRRHE